MLTKNIASLTLGTVLFVANSCFGGIITTLTTNYSGGSSGSGAMFDVVVGSQDLKIVGWELHMRLLRIYNMELYTIPHSWVGSADNSGPWTLAGTASAFGTGPFVGTPVNFGELVLHANTSTGIYITAIDPSTGFDAIFDFNSTSSQSPNYFSGQIGDNIASNSDLTIHAGALVSRYPFGDGLPYSHTGGFTPRTVWNGAISYEVVALVEPSPVAVPEPSPAIALSLIICLVVWRRTKPRKELFNSLKEYKSSKVMNLTESL